MAESPAYGMTMTLDTLARAMKGMPREATIFVRLPDGRLAGIALVRPTLVGQDGQEGRNGEYAITLEVEGG